MYDRGSERRSSIVIGGILIAVGAVFLIGRDLALAGAWALLVGLALFLGFAFFFESVIGLSGGRIRGLDAVLAAGLVVLGVVIVVFSLRPARRAR